MMYFCSRAERAAHHPKYLTDAIALLTAADAKLFIDVQDVEILAIKVRQALEKAMPKSSTAHVNRHDALYGAIHIGLYATDHSETPVASARFQPVSAIVTYDLDDEDFIEVKLKMEEK